MIWQDERIDCALREEEHYVLPHRALWGILYYYKKHKSVCMHDLCPFTSNNDSPKPMFLQVGKSASGPHRQSIITCVKMGDFRLILLHCVIKLWPGWSDDHCKLRVC